MADRADNPVRLRRDAWTEATDEKVTVGATGKAIVLEGRSASTLWRALEPVLRRGFSRGALAGSVPPGGRAAVENLVVRLGEEDLLRAVEEDRGDVPEELISYYEARIVAPVAAARYAATSELRVSGPAGTADRVVEWLRDVGVDNVTTCGDPGDPTGAVVERREPGGGWSLLAFAATSGEAAVVGPTNRRGTRELYDDARQLAVAQGRQGPDDELAEVLRASQLVLCVLDSLAAGLSADSETQWPEYFVSAGGFVSERHTRISLPELDPDRTADAGTRYGPSTREPTEALDEFVDLWDPVTGIIGEPLPGDLDQIPVGAAVSRGRDCHHYGTGITTAAARIDAMFAALRHERIRGRTNATVGIGLTAEQARADAAIRLVAQFASSWHHEMWEGQTATDRARRLHAAITLRAGLPIVVDVAEKDSLVRFRIREIDGEETIGTCLAPDMDAAVEGALLRAAGWAQTISRPRRDRDTSHGATTPIVSRDPLESRSSAVVESVGRWLPGSGILWSVPEGADVWARAGLVAVSARWN